ncbi:leishmanolysin-related zinc metalloendopeptidase [Pseudosulfitobacter pseudonitzschiae]|uniref:leishmanolysin-related zinc metalloendopeptidase n=1 Tax=Pseudosulfitobacter pseudonitzschiae TaxID=1402135 RepID=UPI003B7EAD8A
MALFDFLNSVLRPLTSFVTEIPQRLNNDVAAVDDTVSEVTAPETDSDDLLGDQDTGDADNDTVDGDVTDPEDLLGDQETGNPNNPDVDEEPDVDDDQDTGDADNDVEEGDVTDPEDLLDDQETGDADNDTVDGDVTDPEDLLDDQETGNPGTPVLEPESNPVIGEIALDGEAVADGAITFEERNETIAVSFDVDGLAEGAGVEASVLIDGQTYSASRNGDSFSAMVPVSSLNEGEVEGSVSVTVTDSNGVETTRQTEFDSGITVDLTEPTVHSNPVIGEISFSGDAVDDGSITFDEKAESIQVTVPVTGIEAGADTEVTVSIDGVSYTATQSGDVWIADVPVENLSNGTLSGAASVRVTDTDGTVKTEASSFNSDIAVDLSEPVVTSNPVITAITFEGDILEDGTLTSEELSETFQVQVEVSGIEDGAQVDVSVEVDGNVYQATNDNGVYTAQVPASELSDGQASGKASVLVTDANGETSQASGTFSTTIETDFSNPGDGVFGPEVQSTGEVEMDLDSMTTYTSGKGELGVESDFNITVNFINGGNVGSEIKSAVIQMTEYISSVIQSDFEGFSTFFEDVDDFLLTVGEISFDGEGGVHGSGSATAFRTDGPDAGMASRGSLAIDPADVSSMSDEGVFNDIVLHEILHALGFGSGEAWDKFLEASQEFGDSFRFTGESAIAAYNAQHSDIAAQDDFSDFGVPVESDFGQGNAGSHWDRATFDQTEGGLMAAGTSEFYYGGIDAMTLAAFEDMGYETTWDASDPGAQPGDYDALPAAVQDPDLVNEPVAGMAAAEDLQDTGSMASAEDIDTADADQADDIQDDKTWSVQDLLEGLLGQDVGAEDAAGTPDENSVGNLLDALLGSNKGEAEISIDTDDVEADIFAADTASSDRMVDFGTAVDAGIMEINSSFDMLQPAEDFMG